MSSCEDDVVPRTPSRGSPWVHHQYYQHCHWNSWTDDGGEGTVHDVPWCGGEGGDDDDDDAGTCTGGERRAGVPAAVVPCSNDRPLPCVRDFRRHDAWERREEKHGGSQC